MQIPIRKRRSHRSVVSLISALLISSTAAQAAPSQLNPVVGQEITTSQSESISGNLTFPDADYSDLYFIGVGILGNISIAENDILLSESQKITVNNTAANSGAIGLAIAEATVGKIQGSIDATGVSATHGLRITGTEYMGAAAGQSAYVSEVSGQISATSTRGSSVGIDVANGRIENITDASITIDATLPATREVQRDNEGILLGLNSSIGTISNTTINATVHANNNSAALNGVSVEDNSSIDKIDNLTIVATNNSDSASAVGININSTGTVGKNGGINANVTVNVNDGLAAFITTKNPANLGTISGNYEMNVYNTSEGAAKNSYSVGYLLGDIIGSTTNSLGFSATNELGESNSEGILVNWNETSMSIHRNYGYSTGVVIMGHQDGLEATVLGAGSEINTSVTEGFAVAAWICGMNIEQGALLGNLSATATQGSAFGLAATATDLVDDWIVNQNYDSSTFGNISGNISATVEQETAGTKAVGVQLGNVFMKDGELQVIDTKMTGSFSGNISAELSDTVNADGSLQSSSSGNVVAGIVDMGNQTLSFDGTTQGENNTLGTSVSAKIYNQEGDTKVLRAYGDAVLTLDGGIKLSSKGTSAATAARFEGNLTAGTSATGSGHQSLDFVQGNFDITSESWNANAGITVGSIAGSDVTSLYQTASVTLNDIESTVGETTTFNSNSLTFYANSMSDSSVIEAMAGVSLELESLTIVNVYLAGDDSMYETLYFLDALKADYFDADNTGITYNLYLDGVAYEQHDEFKIVHDSTGIYLSTGKHIPEPSTATLSLVALAGLLARRRRKK